MEIITKYGYCSLLKMICYDGLEPISSALTPEQKSEQKRKLQKRKQKTSS